MKGKNLVIGIVVLVTLVIAAVYFSMMAEINNQKKERGLTSASIVLEVKNTEYKL